MPSRTSPSPSPPPAAPAPTITPLGPRATALHKVYTSALQSTLKSNSYLNFAACFPTPARYCPTALEGVWRQLNTRLQEECLKDFEKILEERKTVSGLNELDALFAQARERRDRGVQGEDEPRALHTLSAKELGEARMHGFLVRTTDELQNKLTTTRNENRQAMEAVKSQREQIENLVAELEGLVGDLEGAVTALEGEGGVEGHDLTKEIWEMETEVKAVT